MSRKLRFGLVLSPAKKCALVRLSEAEGGLSQVTTIRRLIRKEARRCGLWPVKAEEGDNRQENECYG